MTPILQCRIGQLRLCALLLLVGSGASAMPIVSWDLTNATGQTATAISLDANVVGTSITPVGASAWASTAQSGFVAASGWGVSAPDAGDYYEWSVSAAAGYQIQYETITLALFRGISGAQHGAQLWDLRASNDGFAAQNLMLQTFDISATAADTQQIFADADISTVGTQAGTVTFRLYGYDYTAPSDFSGLGNDSGWLIYGTGTNPTVDGSVFAIVPEAGTTMLVGLGLIALAQTSRRNR